MVNEGDRDVITPREESEVEGKLIVVKRHQHSLASILKTRMTVQPMQLDP
jgi:hypothetical protein